MEQKRHKKDGRPFYVALKDLLHVQNTFGEMLVDHAGTKSGVGG